MKRGMGKSGQFYLIAAIILAAIIIGIAAVSNYSRKATNVRIDDLKEELQIESANVLDYGTYRGFSQAQKYTLFNDFAQAYIDSKSEDLYFIFGNENNMTVKGYQESPQKVTLDSLTITEISGEFVGGRNPSLNEIKVSIGELKYKFKIKPGENFYFIIIQEIEGEKYVVTG